MCVLYHPLVTFPASVPAELGLTVRAAFHALAAPPLLQASTADMDNAAYNLLAYSAGLERRMHRRPPI